MNPLDIQTKMKMKGIPAKDRKEDLFMELWNQLTLKNSDTQLHAQFFNVTDVFKSYATGVNISPLLKLISPTLTKRVHNLSDDTSRAHRNVDEF